AALRGTLHFAAILALPRAAENQSITLSLFSGFWRLCSGGIESRDPRESFRRRRHDPPDRRHASSCRNDVGRVATVGTVTVTDQFFIERYSHVMHIVSNVEGKLAENRDALDALVAGFPAGTVSGAPKVRAMQIIDELEKEKRGLYAGCVGYFSAAGEMDTCIVLRTALIKDGTMYVQAGAGIVADSDPDFEQQECINKAKALFRAAEEARRFASAAKRGQ